MIDEDFFSKSVTANTNNIYCISDVETFEVLYLNKVGKKVFGVLNDEYIGRKCCELIANEKEDCIFCRNNLLVRNEYFFKVLERHFSFANTKYELNGRNVSLTIGTDITDIQNELEELRSKTFLETTLVKCAQTLSDNNCIETSINELLSIVGNFYSADRAYIFEICKDETNISNTFEWCGVSVGPQIDNLQNMPIEAVDDWFVRFRETGEFYITLLEDDVNFDSEAYKILEAQGITSLLASPIIIGGKIIGFMGVDNPSHNLMDTTLLRSSSLFLANDIKNKNMIYEVERLASVDVFTGLYNRNKYMQFINQITDGAVSTVGIVYLDINGLKRANDEGGHKLGDELILKATAIMKNCFVGNIFRIGGDEFVALLVDCERSNFDEHMLKLRATVDMQTDVSVSIGSVWCNDSSNILQQIAYADELMYIDKQNYYKKHKGKQKTHKATNVKQI